MPVEILILDEGRILQTGKTEAVFARPVSETVARVLGAENVGFGVAGSIRIKSNKRA